MVLITAEIAAEMLMHRGRSPLATPKGPANSPQAKTATIMQTNAMAVFDVPELMENILENLDEYELVQALKQNSTFCINIMSSPTLRARLPLDNTPSINEKARGLERWRPVKVGLYDLMSRNPAVAQAVTPLLSTAQREELLLTQAPEPSGWSRIWLKSSDKTNMPSQLFPGQDGYFFTHNWGPNEWLVTNSPGNYCAPQKLFRLPSNPDIVYEWRWSSWRFNNILDIIRCRDQDKSTHNVDTIRLIRRNLSDIMTRPDSEGKIRTLPPTLQPFQLEMFLITHQVPFLMQVRDLTPEYQMEWGFFESTVGLTPTADIFCPAGTKMRHLAAWTEAWAQGAEGDLLGVASNGMQELTEAD